MILAIHIPDKFKGMGQIALQVEVQRVVDILTSAYEKDTLLYYHSDGIKVQCSISLHSQPFFVKAVTEALAAVGIVCYLHANSYVLKGDYSDKS